VQAKGNFDVFEELFADDFADHPSQPNVTPDKPCPRGLHGALWDAFPKFHAHWQTADGEIVTTQALETCRRRSEGGPRRDQALYC
jgi:hypothetical protein